MTDQNTTVFDDKPVTESTSFDTKEATTEPKVSVQDLVGEDKKYKTVDDLAKGSKYADDFIGHLQAENKELREEVNKSTNAARVLDKLQEPKQPEARDHTNPELSEDAIAQIVHKHIETTEKSKLTQANLKYVDDRLKEAYGDKVLDVLTKRSEELGITLPFMKTTAETSPEALLSLLGLNSGTKPSEVSQPMKSSVNTSSESFNRGAGHKYGSKAYFDEIRTKEGNSKYFTVKVQNELFKCKQQGLYDS